MNAADQTTSNNGAAVKTNDQTPAKQKDVTMIVAQNVRGYLEKGTLVLPADYSVENAIKSAYLTIQEVQDMNKKPALAVCSQASVMNALLDMVVQGLNPAKKQCYFIVYGSKLVCQRSYFGDQALAQRVKPGIEFYSGVIRKGDEFEVENIRGRVTVAKHGQKFENFDNPIIGAYCGVVDTVTGEDMGAEVMTIDQIHKSWEMSNTYKADNKAGTHARFDKEMCLRTVIRKRCKPIINASSDTELLKSITRQDLDRADADIDEEVATYANAEVLDIEDTSGQSALPTAEQGDEPTPTNASNEEAPY